MVRGVMSQKSHHDIACPGCGAELCVELYDSVLVDEEPGLRTDLLTGKEYPAGWMEVAPYGVYMLVHN